MIDPSYLFLEVCISILFLVTCYHAYRRHAFLEVVTAALYGLLLEEGDILLFGTYHYSDAFVLRIDHVPVAIGLAWAMIIYTCMHLSDAYGLSTKIAPFADAVWAIMLDLAFDAIAIRLGFWTWVIPLDAGFFGVPAGNFYAWLFVAFSFSVFTRLARKRNSRSEGFGLWQVPVPFIAYAGLLVSLIPFFAVRNLFFPERGGGMPIFWGVLCLFVLIVARELIWARQVREVRLDWIPVLLRSSFHLYFLGALLVTGMFMSTPALLAISVTVLLLDTALVVLLWNSSRYANKVAKQTVA